MLSLVHLVCPEHQQPLEAIRNGSALLCPSGCSFPVIDRIPRFVRSEAYAKTFGNQWKMFAKTQLDSQTGSSISRERLNRCLGGTLEAVIGKLVLEAGCGAGRFTEILLDAGARVVSCDLSSAVEANKANFP